MNNVCADHYHKLQINVQTSLEKSLRDINTPRKLLPRRAGAATDMFSDETLFHKYLPHNSSDDSDDSDDDSGDPYSSDHFRMYEFKVRRCTRSRSHDWTNCPFAHPGEKARRRDPRRFHYSGTVCPEYRRGGCSRGDACEFSHGVFECWLHPSRYRTEACKDGKNCKRKVCFFAHTPKQLRVLMPNSPNENDNFNNKKSNHNNNNNNKKLMNCCLFCHCSSCCTNSPTSTLFGMSSSNFSPPISPSSSPNSLNYELLCSFEGLNFGEVSPISSSKSLNFPWFDYEDQQKEKNFTLLPTFSSGKENLLREENRVFDDVNIAPDLGWVNELLM